MGSYLRLAGSLAQNLARRVGEDLADCAAVCKRGLVYKLRSWRLRYDDVGPEGSQDWHILPEQLALLVESVENKPWFCELDRRAAQELVHDGGSGCFVVRPSTSTKSLTLTLWFNHRPYNILIRQREDGLLALGSKKDQEMTFHSVDEMVRYYEREPLILYSGGELTGRTRLRAPPPGLVRVRGSVSSTSQLVDSSCSESRRSSSLTARRPSAGVSSESEECHNAPVVCTRTLSSGHCEVPFSSSITRRLAVSAPNMHVKVFSPANSPSRLSSEELAKQGKNHKSSQDVTLKPHSSGVSFEQLVKPSRLKESSLGTCEIRNHLVTKRPLPPLPNIPGEAVPSLSQRVLDASSCESTCL